MPGKSSSIFQEDEREKMEAHGATRIIIMDQGSRGGPSIISAISKLGDNVHTLIIDHHESDAFPTDALVVSACHSSPVATSSLLTYLVCLPLHESVREACAVSALLGVFGDLGPSAVKWGESPWLAHLGDVMKRVTKKALLEAVSMMNASRRTAEYQVYDAWEIILHARSLKDISTNRKFLVARESVNAEVERCTHTAPAFSRDGRVALLRIHSGYQVHPVIAIRWAGHLRARNLQLVMVANSGYHPSGVHTNFSCRIVAGLRKMSDTERPNLIEILNEYASKVTDAKFLERVGGDFAKGHKEATGGIILTSDFENFVKAMEIGIKPDTTESNSMLSKKVLIDPGQKTKITSFFSPIQDVIEETCSALD
ncbi:hypothetical protein EW145_g1795 [Phellinidium pouzarii]|uniref:Uncharacterized protein n=1 Tax=Phellinidium pouzarii TaxID=167371 RepID=A0A4S4LDD1_9AGAM|nr:hypothetical protein EW145_g1795 [Phellinidium pouzarii]